MSQPTINVRLSTGLQLVAFYNQHSVKPVKKFRDRVTAEKRVTELMAEMAYRQPAPTPVPVKAVKAAKVVGAFKPWQAAKVIISDLLSAGVTSRKEILAACMEAGIKYNTADGAHYEMCVKK